VTEVERKSPTTSTRRGAVLACGCIALVMIGYVLGSRHSLQIHDGFKVTEVGAILKQSDFETLYTKMTTGLTDAELTARVESIVAGTPASTNANVKLLQDWYSSGTTTNKVFVNELIAASLTKSKAATAAAPALSAGTASISCPVSTYEAFGKLYSDETAGKTWEQIERIDSWVRRTLPAVGAPLSVLKLRDCYKNVLSTADQKDFSDNAVQHMLAGNPN